jgi:general L-amino acid transport system substrate-binding protein
MAPGFLYVLTDEMNGIGTVCLRKVIALAGFGIESGNKKVQFVGMVALVLGLGGTSCVAGQISKGKSGSSATAKVAVAPTSPLVATDAVLTRVRAAHALSCGVIKEEEDYSHEEDHGNRAAFDLDLCKAVAIAVLGPGAHFVVKAYPDEAMGIKALSRGEIELIATASPNVVNTARGVRFARTMLYDGESLMILNNPAIHSAADLAGKKVCFVIESRTETGLRSWAARHQVSFIWYPFSEIGEMEAAFFTDNCSALAGDVTQLANQRAIGKARSHEFTILPQLLRKDPLAPASMADAPQFAAVVDWTMETLIDAEELGVTQANAATLEAGASGSNEPDVQQLLGQKYGSGALLGLRDHWGADLVEAVGNYGEIFKRDLGEDSPLRLDRGENRLWSDGGLMYGLPVANP